MNNDSAKPGSTQADEAAGAFGKGLRFVDGQRGDADRIGRGAGAACDFMASVRVGGPDRLARRVRNECYLCRQYFPVMI